MFEAAVLIASGLVIVGFIIALVIWDIRNPITPEEQEFIDEEF